MPSQPKYKLWPTVILTSAWLLLGHGLTAQENPASEKTTEIVQIPILVRGNRRTNIPDKANIVIASINGECAEPIKHALMKRLIDNNRYSVLTRDNLQQIIGEADLSWAGRFNTETATKLGRLMGASLWVVGRVAYCGRTFAESTDDKNSQSYTILATLQLIDINTGKVLVSSASEGTYIPRNFAKLALASLDSDSPSGSDKTGGAHPTGRERLTELAVETVRSELGEAKSGERLKNFGGRVLQKLRSSREKTVEIAKKVKNKSRKSKALEYVRLRAAEDLVDDFADRFFSRPSWEVVEMWNNKLWTYGKASRLVKLGHCSEASEMLKTAASKELPFMNEIETAEYLHNYGVTLLCSNELNSAIKKLRAAYRISTNISTLKMLGLTGRIEEWSLEMPPEEEPEVERLVQIAAK